MKLSFLGQTYEHSPQTIDTVLSERAGKFLGKTYLIRRPVTTYYPCQKGLKYRGKTY